MNTNLPVHTTKPPLIDGNLEQMDEKEYIEHKQAAVAMADVKKLMAADLNMLAAQINPDIAEFAYPPFFQTIYATIMASANTKARTTDRYGIGIPRGFAKTEFIKLLATAVGTLSNRRFILVVGATATHAEALVADIARFIKYDTTLNQLFDIKVDKDRGDWKEYTIDDKPLIIQAAGAGSAVRGKNSGGNRPDMIILDDAQTMEVAASVERSREFIKWFQGTLYKAKSEKGATIMYVGNMYREMEVGVGRWR